MNTNMIESLVSTLDTFTRAYIDCALWTEEDRLKEDADRHEDDYEPASRWDVNIHAFASEALESIKADCEAFQTTYATLLDKAKEWSGDYENAQAGHDYWLTRNRHGAGFWDRGLGPVGEELRYASHAEGSSDLYFGDDGKIYVS